MKNEVVKFDNEINKISFQKFNQSDLDIFMKICMEVCEKGIDTVEVPFSEIKDSIKYDGKSKKQFIEMLLQFCQKIGTIRIRDIDGETAIICLFTKMKPIKSKEILQIKVNKENAHYFNDLKKAFTTVGFKEIISMSSKYSKNLYRLLMQWRTKGHCPTEHEDKYFTVEEIRFYLDTPDYDIKFIKKFILDPAVAEINEKGTLENVVLNVHKAKKRGAPVVGYSFNFEQQKKLSTEQKQTIECKKNNTGTKKNMKNKFNDFPQNEYDFDKLEEKLLSNKGDEKIVLHVKKYQ